MKAMLAALGLTVLMLQPSAAGTPTSGDLLIACEANEAYCIMFLGGFASGARTARGVQDGFYARGCPS